LTLSPKTETDNVFTTASETATVKDANGKPVPGVVVRFTVTGANPTSGSQTTDQFGQATFSYTGQNTGVDTIKAFADTNNNGAQDTGEPSDTATKTWVTQVTSPGCTVKITNGGTIIAANGDQSSFGGNAQASSSGSSGQEQYQDHGPKQPLNAHSIDISSVTCNPQQTQATIEGHATINGSGSYTFQIIVQDNGSSGSSDAYGIRLSNGYNSGVQPLRSGNVDIHKQ
ncbi:MAG: Ig-like domain-containing protein, partial [Gaiellaceae bacterium]